MLSFKKIDIYKDGYTVVLVSTCMLVDGCILIEVLCRLRQDSASVYILESRAITIVEIDIPF